MEFLKEVLGDLYSGFETKVSEYNRMHPEQSVKLANLSAGGYVSREKYAALEETVKEYKQQVQSANDRIQQFNELDIDGIRKAAADWEALAKKTREESEAKLRKLEFEHALEKELVKAGARNAKAVGALLNQDGMKLEGGTVEGLEEQLKQIRKDNEFLFETDESKPVFTTKTKQQATGSADSFMAALMTGAKLNKE